MTFNKQSEGEAMSSGKSLMPAIPSTLVLSGQQHALLRALDELNRKLSAMYRGGIMVLGDTTNPERIAQCAHSMRELMEKLPEKLDVPTIAQKEKLKSKVREIEDIFLNTQKTTGYFSSLNRMDGIIDRNLHKFMMRLVDFFEWFASHYPRRRDEFLSLLDRLDGSSKALLKPLASQNYVEWDGIRDYFVSVAHHRCESNEQEIHQKLDALERFLLDRLVPRTFDDFAEIDAYSKMGAALPSAEIIEKVLELIRKRQANHDYFFSKLNSANWIAPLDKEGLFIAPPPDVRDGDTIRFPFWAESQYLTRIASEAPEQVAEIMMKIPETDNVRVHEDLALAAAKLPGFLAARWAWKETKWVERQNYLYFLLPESLGKLIEYLAKSGEAKKSLALARAVLRVRLVGDTTKRVSALFDIWNYKQLIQKHFPEVIRQTGRNGLALLCDLLENALIKETEGKEDYSWIWRPAIEQNAHNHGYDDIRDIIIDAIRDNLKLLIHDEGGLQSVLQEFLKRKKTVFSRLALHVLAENCTHPTARDLAYNRENFFDRKLWPEYGRLLAAVFSDLDAEAKSSILGWIEEGPLFQSDNDEEGEDLRWRRKAYWQLQRLKDLQGKLPKEWENRYSEIVSQMGEPEHPTIASRMAIRMGWTSPKETIELESMKVEEIAVYLKEWKPTHEWNSPEPEGFGLVLQSVIAKSPDRFVASLDSFRNVDPTYARALVQGLNEAVKTGQVIEWAPVIEYLAWIVAQPRKEVKKSDGRQDSDPHWGWARKAVASLLSIGFEKDIIDFMLRERSWQVIATITSDPDPSIEDDETSTMDPATRSINTTRGEALHTVVRYALWVYRELVEKDGKRKRHHFNMASIPEVRDCLDRHLDTGVDPSPAVRAVYGQWFPWLMLLDSAWTEASIEAIFSDGSPVLRDAAWLTYLALGQVYNDSFLVLRRQYSESVSRLSCGNCDDESGWLGRPGENLGEHLMTMVGRGVLDSIKDEDLIKRFFENAPIQDASHAIDFTGRLLWNESEQVPKEVAERFRLLWEKLTSDVLAGSSERKLMLKPFGWWFVSGRFESAWAFTQLKFSIEAAGGIDPDYKVMERLAEIADKYPVESLEILKALARLDEQGWNVLGWIDSAKTIILAAIKIESTKSDAIALIHELGARGHFQFRELLSE